MKFVLVVVAGPAENYIEKCLESIISQDRDDWVASVVLDRVGDKTVKKAYAYAGDKIRIHVNDKRMLACHNRKLAIDLIDMDDEDIIVIIDGDDWFSCDHVLSFLYEQYNGTNTLLTHGSFISHPYRGKEKKNKKYDAKDFKNLRKNTWHCSHLLTMKYKLWKHVEDESLRDKNGNYYDMASDLALMIPALEMAGLERVKFIPEILLVYNRESAYSDSKVNRKNQIAMANEIRAKKPYQYKEVL